MQGDFTHLRTNPYGRPALGTPKADIITLSVDTDRSRKNSSHEFARFLRESKVLTFGSVRYYGHDLWPLVELNRLMWLCYCQRPLQPNRYRVEQRVGFSYSFLSLFGFHLGCPHY